LPPAAAAPDTALIVQQRDPSVDLVREPRGANELSDGADPSDAHSARAPGDLIRHVVATDDRSSLIGPCAAIQAPLHTLDLRERGEATTRRMRGQ
jgi:hypothetical protein